MLFVFQDMERALSEKGDSISFLFYDSIRICNITKIYIFHGEINVRGISRNES